MLIDRSSLVSAIALVLAASMLMLTPGTVLAEIPEEQQRWLDRRMPEDERAVLDSTIGFAPPELPEEFRWVEGEPVQLSELRGRVVVLQSWSRASSSGRAAPRRVQQLLEDFAPEDVVIVAIHTPEGEQGLEAFLERVPVGVRSAVDPRGAWCDEMGIFRRPVTVLLDRNGAIRFAGVTYGSLADAVEFLVKEEPSETAPAPLASRDERMAPEEHPTRGPAVVNRAYYPREMGNPGSAKDLRNEKGPDIHVERWIINAPRTMENKVVVVEFWATWCGPCIKGIPHLNDLQEKLAGRAVILGVSNEAPATVENFVKQTKMNYAVAIDQQATMMKFVGNRGIPHCIVMSPDGIVRWQGHPAQLSANTLEQIADAAGVPRVAEEDGDEGQGGGDRPSISGKRWLSKGAD